MLFIDHVNVVLQKLRQDPITQLSTDTTSEAYRAQTAVNRAISRIWNHKPWSFKRRTDSRAFGTSTDEVFLQEYIGEIYNIISNQHPYKISPLPEHLFNLYVPNPTATGNPYIGVLSHIEGVEQQVVNTGTIQVLSSSSSDTTQTVLIKGLVNSEEDYEAVTLNGGTPVNTTKSFSKIFSVTKSGTTVGRVVVLSNAGDGTLVTLSPLEQTVRLRKMRLYPQPSTTGTLTIYHLAPPPYLTHAYEDHQIPRRWDYVVDQWAFALALQAKGQDQLAEFQTQLGLATKMLEEDMASEEMISIEEPVIPLKAGEGGYANQLMAPPSGTSFVE